MSNEFADFELSLDLTEVPAMSGEFSNLPPGEYVFEIENLKQETSKKQNAMIVMQAVVVEARDVPGAENLDVFVGQKAWNRYSLLPQSAGRIKQLAVACGAALTGFRASEYIGARFLATVTYTKGDAQVGADGQPQAPMTFANIVNERPLDEAPAAAAEAPPITKTVTPSPPAAKGKPATNGARRA